MSRNISRSMGVVAAACLAITVLTGVAGQQRPPAQSLVLSVRHSTSNMELFPASSWYIAELRNESNNTETLEAIQMPGGIVGSGRFFACGIEAWNSRRHKWVPLHPANPTDYGHHPNFVNVELKAGEQVDACSWLLPSQAGHAGQCVRLTFEPRWKQDSAKTVVSKPFVIQEKGTATTGSCPAY